MKTLVIPPAAQRDEDAVQMLSAWVAEKGLHCTINVGMWNEAGRNEPAAWGVLLADVVRHHELDAPTSEATGSFHPGHS